MLGVIMAGASMSSMVLKIRDIAEAVPPIARFATAETAFSRFTREPGRHALPIVEDGAPIGLLARRTLLEAFSANTDETETPRQREAAALADITPQLVDIEALAGAVAARAAHEASPGLIDGFIVTEEGRYAGYVSAASLLKAVAAENLQRAAQNKKLRSHIQHAEAASKTREAAQSQFLAKLGHELRNSLTAIIGLTDLIEQDKLSKRARRHAGAVTQSGRHLRRLLDDLVDFARLGSDLFKIDPSPFELNAFASEVRDLWSGEASARGLDFLVSLVPKTVKRIEADRERALQIVNRLVLNALENTNEGLVSVEIGAEPSESGLELSLTVSDTGQSVSADRRARVFDAFADRREGAGLGLSVARDLARRMGGDIEYSDNKGGGSVFTARMTAHKAGPRLAVDNPQISKPPRGAFTLGDILIVDDYEPSRILIREALSGAGWRVHSAASGAEALRMARERAYQAVICELRLPDTTGESFLTELKGVEGAAKAVKLALTTDVAQERKRRATAFGFDGVLEKPIRSRPLVTALADAILKHADPQAARRRRTA